MININIYAPLINLPGMPLDQFLEMFGTGNDGASFMEEGMFEILTERATVFKKRFKAQFDDEVEVLFSVQWCWVDKGISYLWIFHWGESSVGITDRSRVLIFLREVPGKEGILYVADGNPRTWEPLQADVQL